MAEDSIMEKTDISPEGEIARLPHKNKIFRAMHGGSKPERQFAEEEFFDLGDLVKDESNKTHEKNPEALAKKLGEALGVELHLFGSADTGKEHIILEDKENNELYKIDKFSPDAKDRKDKAIAYNLMRALSHGRLPKSRMLEVAGETGTVVEKMDVHPRFEEARKAVKKGDPTLWNEITGSYFSEVLDEWAEMGFDYWNDPSLDADERDNYITVAAKNKQQSEQNKNAPGYQVFVDDFWEYTKKQYAQRDVIRRYVQQHPEKYPPEEVVEIMDALKAVEDHVENKDKEPKAADMSIPQRELTHA